VSSPNVEDAPQPSGAGPPLVAVVGRPNVGKSTLVNRIVGGRPAIVEEKPGVTRDRKELVAEWSGRDFRIVDTGGWLGGRDVSRTADDRALVEKVSAQAERAIRDADVVLFVTDVTVGVTTEDERAARLLRSIGTPVIVVANKVDDERRRADSWEMNALGLGDPFPISAVHARGTGDLLDALVDVLPPAPESSPEREGDGEFAVAIVGRPNVGKSTLFNRLVGDERSVVHDAPGTTRDSVDTVVDTPDGPIRFVDTAGMRRRSRVDEPTEYYSVVRALESVDRADAALFVIDASQGVSHQDQRLAERIDGGGTAIVVVLNKWDLVEADDRDRVKREVGDRLAFLGYAPVLTVSALTRRRLHHLLPALREAEAAYHSRVPTSQLNRVLRDAQRAHPPPVVRGRRPRILYATQGAAEPPTFTLFATKPLPRTYMRYLERKIREAFDLGPTPIRLRVRRRDES
jgi:GTP-binding protein